MKKKKDNFDVPNQVLVNDINLTFVLLNILRCHIHF